MLPVGVLAGGGTYSAHPAKQFQCRSSLQPLRNRSQASVPSRMAPERPSLQRPCWASEDPRGQSPSHGRLQRQMKRCASPASIDNSSDTGRCGAGINEQGASSPTRATLKAAWANVTCARAHDYADRFSRRHGGEPAGPRLHQHLDAQPRPGRHRSVDRCV